MANIRVDSDLSVFNGQTLTFRAPADISQVSGLVVYYPSGSNTVSKVFQFADAHGENVGNIDNLFSTGVIVKVVLDVDHEKAFVQNADTNAYLEAQFEQIRAQMSGNTQGGVFIAKYGDTTFEEIEEAHNAGKSIVCEMVTSNSAQNSSAMHMTLNTLIEKSVYVFTAYNESVITYAQITSAGNWSTSQAAGYTPGAHNQVADTITAGTFAGKVQGNSTAMATVANAQLRDIKAGTADLTAGVSTLATGTLYFVYE